jgi:hypothetical protein
VSTEENLITEKKKKVLLYHKNTRISHWLWDTWQISIWTPLVALQISSLYSASSHAQESVSITAQILSFSCCRYIIFCCTQCFWCTHRRKNQEQLNLGCCNCMSSKHLSLNNTPCFFELF